MRSEAPQMPALIRCATHAAARSIIAEMARGAYATKAYLQQGVHRA